MINVTKKVYTVVIEWDGVKPPTKFYTRLHASALRVRGQDDLFESEPVQRRAVGDLGVIFQEGCIITSSESLARTIANLARTIGADFGLSPSIIMFEGTAYPMELSDGDVKALDRIQEVMGKRGRRPEPDNFVITCLEKLQTYEVKATGVAFTPEGGTNFNSIRGDYAPRFDYPTTYREWVDTRFCLGKFIVPILQVGEGLPNRQVAYHNLPGNVANTLSAMEVGVNNGVLPSPDQNPDTIYVLDAVYAARTHHIESTVLKARVEAVTNYFLKGGSPSKVSIAQNPHVADILDAACILGPEIAADWFIKVVGL